MSQTFSIRTMFYYPTVRIFTKFSMSRRMKEV